MFSFCPRCGSAAFHPFDSGAQRCADCGFVYYLNASAATVAVIFDKNDRLLVVRRANEPARGTLDLPGGFVEPNEDVETSLKREVLEETRGEVRIERFLFSIPNTYEYSGFNVPTADLFFACQLLSDVPLQAADDAAEFLWIPRNDLRPADFGLTSIRQGIERLLQL